jgi:hypothetical protein
MRYVKEEMNQHCALFYSETFFHVVSMYLIPAKHLLHDGSRYSLATDNY